MATTMMIFDQSRKHDERENYDVTVMMMMRTRGRERERITMRERDRDRITRQLINQSASGTHIFFLAVSSGSHGV